MTRHRTEILTLTTALLSAAVFAYLATIAVGIPPVPSAFATSCGTGSNIVFTDIGSGQCRGYLTSVIAPTGGGAGGTSASMNGIAGTGGGGGGGAFGNGSTAGSGGAGGLGTDWDSSHGSGGGGGGDGWNGNHNNNLTGGAGGLYGGGAGGSTGWYTVGAPGAQGIIVITYTPQGVTTCGAGSNVSFNSIGGGQCRAYMTTVGAGSFIVPSNWNAAQNTIETIAGGGGGQNANGAGGGGGYSEISNASLSPGATVAYNVGVGGSGGTTNGNVATSGPGGDTYLCNTTANCTAITGSAVIVGAKGGIGGNRGSGGAGGSAASGVGAIRYSGGNGTGSGDTSGGGGGAGGPHGNGGNGGVTAGVNYGGAGGGAGSGGSVGGTGNGNNGATGGNSYFVGGVTTFTVPSNWNNTNNTIEVIGGGGGGSGYQSGSNYGSGGGGGAYAKAVNVTLTPNTSAAYMVGGGGAAGYGTAAGGAGLDTYFCNSTGNCASIVGTAVVSGAKGGAGGVGGIPGTGGAGGTGTAGVGSVKNSGGAGVAGNSGVRPFGGGAAGPVGGGTPGNGSSGAGGSGDAGSGGAGGVLGSGVGGTGTEWDASHGAGGGGGAYISGSGPAGAGGLYGGGGAGAGYSGAPGAESGGAGIQGIIVITYTAATGPSVTTSAASSVTSTGATLNGTITATGGVDATQHGFAYATSSSLRIGVSTSTLGGFSGIGSFTQTLSNLTPATTYYYRSYATNSQGTGYGSIVPFTTGNAPVVASCSVTAGGTPLEGYAWSDTIGWIDMNCSNTNSCGTNNFGMSIAPDGTISGCGWSDYAGWVSASPAAVANCPSGTCNAQIQSGGSVTGWMRALSADNTWDGWISLYGSNYGVSESGGIFSGYAWGDTNIGWLDFSKVKTLFNTCTVKYTCNGTQTTIYQQQTSCQLTTVATCSNSSFCVEGQGTCQEPPVQFISGNGYSGHLQVSPQIVRKQRQVNVHWSVANVSSCTVTGSNGDGPWNDYNAASQTSTGAHQSAPIVQQTNYTLTCVPLDGSTFAPERVTVNMIPVFQEN